MGSNPYILNLFLYLLLKGMAVKFIFDKKFRELIKNSYSVFNATISFQTRDKKIKVYCVFKNGKMKVKYGIPENPELLIIFKDRDIIREFIKLSPEEVLDYLLKNKIVFKGNLSYLLKFSYILSNFLSKKEKEESFIAKIYCGEKSANLISRRGKLTSFKHDNVKYLEEPYLQKYCIEDFPHLKCLREKHFVTKPEICTERARLITEYFLKTGFEFDSDGKRREPVLRQAEALNYILSNKKPVIKEENLLAGTTTSKNVGVVLYPEGHGVTLWPELKTVANRRYQPYNISPEDIELLDKIVFPFWSERNVREWARKMFNFPRCQELDEKFVLYFMWKTVALSHTIPDFPKLLLYGLVSIIEEAKKKEETADSQKKKNFYKAVQIALNGVLKYAENLKKEAERLAKNTDDENLKRHYTNISKILERVPAYPATTLYEAVQSIWILWVALHNESTNAGLSLGHLDLWLQPYFEKDMEKLKTEEERENYIKFAISLIGNFFLNCQDHLPLVADIGNKLFGGSSSDQVITIGGVDEKGNSAVCDMTYIILKVAEMLTIRDPNLNARYYPGVNSDEYLKRLIEVNLITTATPSIHNDKAMIRALKSVGFKEEDARCWVATGCVEPTIPGKHFGHTNSMMFNMVAALEMALNNGVHPLIDEQIGPKTGDIYKDEFPTFEDFFKAFKEQLKFLAYQAIDYNNYLGVVHQIIRPTPILSSLFEGPLEKGKDLTEGGAIYNSSGVACIGLTDIVDSLFAIKKLVYEERKIDFKELHRALQVNFEGYEKIHSMIVNKVPKFGSDHPEVNRLAQEVVDAVFEIFYNRLNYRGGHYFPGYWSMSNHVAFGSISGALPSGRLKFKPFTPGLTPENVKGVDLLTSIRTISKLNPEKMPNNIAFNVKIAPDSRDSYEEIVNQVFAYTKSYFELGGMQIQFNMVTTKMLRDAMEHPENYRNLLVRISGYNAYFVELNREMQLEIIERQELRV